ncbi:MAG: ribonuclease P protein component [Candidatus Omnitrophica bacterium]|nr:ribonuclease P protein component [Candidatus Omnitrophota bacterium]
MISDERFGKKEHLLKSRDFSKVYKKGLPARAGGVIVYCLANDLGRNRLGFSIGSRNIKRATSRNRIRRLFREAYRKNKGKLKAGFDIVMVIRKDLHKELTFDSAEGTFLKLAQETKIIL